MEPMNQTELENVLNPLGLTFEIIEIDPALADTADFCTHYNVPLDQSANTLVIASKAEPKTFVACVVLATTRLDVNGKVRKKMGVRKTSFSTAEEMKALTGMQVGGVTPLGLPTELPLWIDSRVMDCKWIIVGGGGRDLKVKMDPQVLLKLGGESVVDLAKAPA